MSSRRIVHVVESLDPWGTQRALAEVVAGLPSAEFEHVVVSARGGLLDRQFQTAGAKVIAVAAAATPSLAATIRAWRAVRHRKPDVIHLWDDWALGRLGPPLACSTAAPIVCSLRNPPRALDFGKRSAARFVLSRAAAVIADDPLLLEQGQAAYLRNARIPQVCRVIDDVGCCDSAGQSDPMGRKSLLSEFSLPSGTLLIGTASQITQAKNLRDLVFAAALLRLVRDDFRLIICGDGPGLAALQRFNTLMRMDDLTIFTGPRLDACRLVSQFDAYVDCSACDGPARSIAEAQAAGVPVIGVDCPQRRRQIRSEIDGLLYPAGDPGALTRQLYHLLGDDTLRARLSAAARETAAARPSASAIAAQYAECYRSIVRR